MRPIATFTVAPRFPERLHRLKDISSNLYWTWNPTIRECLRAIDPDAWHRSNHHPLRTLQALPAGHLDNLATDAGFLSLYDAAVEELDSYLAAPTWYGARHTDGQCTIAYLSAEFGLHESVPLYSGGLGVLSGDHTKSASDLGLPLVCVGLMYQMGYFRQRLAMDGTQLEDYDRNDPSRLPLVEVDDGRGRPLRISVDFPKGPVSARIWRMDAGRVPLYLLDTNIPENTVPEYRDIADYLYGGDQETRIMQEIVLGIGGMRALRALGINATVTHSNEGHSAFLMLERTRMLMQELGMNFAEASELTAAGSAFTTHTPVPAGNDAFPPELMEKYFTAYWPQLGLTREEFLGLGREHPGDAAEHFSMTVLALRLTSKRNGVSRLHGDVSREMWRGLWSNLPATEVPIIGITNGVHTTTWVADSMAALFDKRLGATWRTTISEPDTWAKAVDITDAELWDAKRRLRSEMIDYVHRRLDDQQAEWYSRTDHGRNPGEILNPDVLTIGFARRFATYKRATLLFRDPERAFRLFTDPERPIQLVIAGKAHPKDLPGKDFIKRVISYIRQYKLESRIVFIEDYDMAVGRRMTQGCDVWLNTPRRPQEASGTSGMKAAVNGTLNLSILDGWYPEGYDGTNGFAIGNGEEFNDTEMQDEFESRKLYRVLEEKVLPTFYTHDAEGLPAQWIAMQRRALVSLAGQFSAERMVREYAERFYFPCSDRYRRMYENGGAAARSLVAWKRYVNERWASLRFEGAWIDTQGTPQVDGSITVHATVALGNLSTDDIRLQAYHGAIDIEGMVTGGTPTDMQLERVDNETALYTARVPLTHVGHAGITVRAFPWHTDLGSPFDLNLLTWAG